MASIEELVFKQTIHTAMLEVFKQKVPRDSDGDWPIQSGDQYAYLKMEMSPTPHVLIFSRAAVGTSEDSLHEVHDLNASALWAKIVRTSTGDIFIHQRIPQATLTSAVLHQAIGSVLECAKECGPMLQAVYGTSSDASDAR